MLLFPQKPVFEGVSIQGAPTGHEEKFRKKGFSVWPPGHWEHVFKIVSPKPLPPF
jgi:hypothetical protein